MATLQTIGVLEDSSLRNLDQIPFPDASPPVQNPSDTVDEEGTPSIRELVRVIDSHVKLVNLEVTSNLCTSSQPNENVQIQPPPSAQPTEDIIKQPAKDAALISPADPSA